MTEYKFDGTVNSRSSRVTAVLFCIEFRWVSKWRWPRGFMSRLYVVTFSGMIRFFAMLAKFFCGQYFNLSSDNILFVGVSHRTLKLFKSEYTSAAILLCHRHHPSVPWLWLGSVPSTKESQRRRRVRSGIIYDTSGELLVRSSPIVKTPRKRVLSLLNEKFWSLQKSRKHAAYHENVQSLGPFKVRSTAFGQLCCPQRMLLHW